MTKRLSQPESVNVLISNADWAWPQAVTQIFQPLGINALISQSTRETVRIIVNNKIHLAILDTTTAGNPQGGYQPTDDQLNAMNTLKIIRKHDQLLPCILLAKCVDRRLLADALALEAFSVLAKPVDLGILVEQIDRLFTKCYASDMFSHHTCVNQTIPGIARQQKKQNKNVSTVIKWTIRKRKKN